jgi:hypothetical protein
MRYDQRRFSVGVGGTKEYEDGWERIFGKKNAAKPALDTPMPGEDEHFCLVYDLNSDRNCGLRLGHSGPHKFVALGQPAPSPEAPSPGEPTPPSSLMKDG